MKPISPSVHVRSESLKGFVRGVMVALTVVAAVTVGAFLLPGVLEIVSLFAFKSTLLPLAASLKGLFVAGVISIGSLANAGMLLGGIALGGGMLGAMKGATQGAYHNQRIATCNKDSPLCNPDKPSPQLQQAKAKNHTPPIETLGMQPEDVARIRQVKQAQPAGTPPRLHPPVQQQPAHEQIPLDALKMPPEEAVKHYDIKKARPATPEEIQRMRLQNKPAGPFTANVIEERSREVSLQRG